MKQRLGLIAIAIAIFSVVFSFGWIVGNTSPEWRELIGVPMGYETVHYYANVVTVYDDGTATSHTIDYDAKFIADLITASQDSSYLAMTIIDDMDNVIYQSVKGRVIPVEDNGYISSPYSTNYQLDHTVTAEDIK